MKTIRCSFAVLLLLTLLFSCISTAHGEKTQRSGQFEYRILDDGTAEITRYH